jgi:glycosyltransferase involved in cell wall biosynthesis
MMNKKTILVVNEFSRLSTGFSNYMRELLPRLHATGKYRIVEFATYINKQHPELDEVEWEVIPNEPDPNNPQERQIYDTNKLNQFGMWKFDEVLLHVKPDIVISIRDPWMDNFITRSPLRKHFKYIHMPTCDGQPQKREWLEFYKQADLLLTYSHWAKNIIETETAGASRVFDVAGAGPDPKTFVAVSPEEKRKIKKHVQLPEDAYVVGTVMRNQPRKLFSELFDTFARFLEICRKNNRDDIAAKTFLYCHTSNPDLGWDIPEEIRRYKISHKVIFTYLCQACKTVYPSKYHGDIAVCKNCKNTAAMLPNTMYGVDKETLNRIYHIFDLYAQYSICEGYGIPVIEAKCAGVPVIGINQSATAELVSGGGGIPIKVGRMFQESLNGTNQWRALPDNDDAAMKMFEFFTAEESTRLNLANEARAAAEKYHNWDTIQQIWEKAIGSLEGPNTWLSDPVLIQPDLNIPQGLNNEQFVEWCYRNIVKEPYLLYSEMGQRAIAALNMGYEPGFDGEGKPTKNPASREKLLQNMVDYVQHKNQIELIRHQKLKGAELRNPYQIGKYEL